MTIPPPGFRPSVRELVRSVMLATIAITVLASGEASAQYWGGYSGNAQHTGLSGVASQLPQRVLWHMPVDLNPPFNGNGNLLIHYASPVITQKNTVIVTVRTNVGFQFTAVKGQTGAALWPQPLTTDYILPPHNWIPVCGPTLVSNSQKLAMPGAGGTVYLRTNPDRATGTVTQLAFYGMANYTANKAAINNNVFICTPITADSQGNLYFGFTVSSAVTGAPATGGLARISNTGVGSFITAADATNDVNMKKVVLNCAPAISNDGTRVYAAFNGTNFGKGYLVSLDSQTFSKTTAKRVTLKDVRTGTDAPLPDDGSTSPMVGPDGDVYFGVLETSFGSHHARGWLLHFSGDLATSKTPGSFGWDITPSVVPASAVPSYTGTSSYLILTKYNNYAGVSGDGLNRMAVLDPNATQNDPIVNTALVMKEILTVLGPTPDAEFGGATVREWCVNTTAVDPINKCAVVNSEDGNVYRWDFTTNTLSPALPLAQATGEAYTPTAIGPDGAVYAINRAVLNCCVKNP